ncbi:RICIN domain-containing protein [Streptomyces sp. NBC_01077]|uniref:RICIN domain-containing protein n=1 Tax=Streptomyces sp. NBC_01077 TaxID=2903746 RepID=UPI00386D7927|nr:RICIN domain-containing protein [Streptomyces sp. NBC_01077]
MPVKFDLARFVRRTLGMVAASVLVSLFLPASPASAELGSGWQRLTSYHSGKCLEIADWSTANGAAARQWDCHLGKNQWWFFLPQDNGSDLLFNEHSGKCLEVADWSTANGAVVRQWDCHEGANQQWVWMGTTTTDGLDVIALKNVHSGKCLEMADWRLDNGAPARQWDCHYGDNQLWYAADIPR